tara:strand:+ start:1229 stop:1918 length:690 start_codon:yes stop_codon:yes gene_type:complete
MKIFGLLLFSLFLTSCERTGDQQVAVEPRSPLSLAAVSSNFSMDKKIQKKLYRQQDTVLGRLYLESLVEKRVFVSMEEVSDYYKKTKNQHRRTSREFLVMRFTTTNKDTAQYIRRVLMKKNESQKAEETFGLLVERYPPSRELIKEEKLRDSIKKQFLSRKGGFVSAGPFSAGDGFVVFYLLTTYEKGTIKDLIHIQDDVRSKIYSTKAHLIRLGLVDSLSVVFGSNTK